ncbi:MAG: hypothetical protein KAR87_02700 [Candidatus Aenigmarchaeota archaeon]|nr:hypothetical protein [Candidatus Aenigmarchaeota archaeon]
MDEGVKLVVKIMVALIIAFGVIYVFSERIQGTNDNILKPTEESSGKTISSQLCKVLHGDGGFVVVKDVACDTTCTNKKYLEATDCDATAMGSDCCCRCIDA